MWLGVLRLSVAGSREGNAGAHWAPSLLPPFTQAGQLLVFKEDLPSSVKLL